MTNIDKLLQPEKGTSKTIFTAEILDAFYFVNRVRVVV